MSLRPLAEKHIAIIGMPLDIFAVCYNFLIFFWGGEFWVLANQPAVYSEGVGSVRVWVMMLTWDI